MGLLPLKFLSLSLQWVVTPLTQTPVNSVT